MATKKQAAEAVKIVMTELDPKHIAVLQRAGTLDADGRLNYNSRFGIQADHADGDFRRGQMDFVAGGFVRVRVELKEAKSGDVYATKGIFGGYDKASIEDGKVKQGTRKPVTPPFEPEFGEAFIALLGLVPRILKAEGVLR